MVEHESGMRYVDRQFGEVVREPNRVDAKIAGHGLQFTVSVRDTYRAYVIPLDQKQLERNAPITGQLRRVGRNGHALLNWSRTCREQALGARHFHQANSARAHRGQAVQIAQRRNVLATGFRRLQDGLPLKSADQLSVDANR